MKENLMEMSIKKGILVVSFGTSYTESREKAIGAIERQVADSFPAYEVRRAFTSQMVINKLAARDGLAVDSVEQALNRFISEGIYDLVVQPTHVIKGWEYEKMLESVNAFAGEFTSLKVGLPLLSSKRDFSETVEALMAGILQDYDVNTAVVLMGHGTEHAANEAYNRLLSEFNHKGCENVFVGTVEGTPTLEEVMEKAISKAYKKAVLLPLMVVAGDHAQNDLAGDGEDSWKSIFTNAGFEVECVLKGLGEYEKIRDMYVRHVWDAVNTSAVCDKGRKNSISKQNGGEYWRNKNYSFFQHRECECFPCHKTDDIEDFNCLFCYCPLYTLGDKCGGDFIYTQSGIKNCVNCSVPHKRENYGLIISKYPLIAKLAAKKQEEV